MYVECLLVYMYICNVWRAMCNCMALKKGRSGKDKFDSVMFTARNFPTVHTRVSVVVYV